GLLDKDRAQGLVSRDQGGEPGGEGGEGEVPRELEGRSDVVGRRAGIELVEEPEPFLGKGERRRGAVHSRGDAVLPGPPQTSQSCRELPHFGSLEERLERQV